MVHSRIFAAARSLRGDRRGGEMLGEKHDHPVPGILGRRLVVTLGIEEIAEGVVGTVIAMKFVRYARCREARIDLRDIVRRRIFVELAEKSQYRAVDTIHAIKGRGAGPSPHLEGAAAVPHHGGAEMTMHP